MKSKTMTLRELAGNLGPGWLYRAGVHREEFEHGKPDIEFPTDERDFCINGPFMFFGERMNDAIIVSPDGVVWRYSYPNNLAVADKEPYHRTIVCPHCKGVGTVAQ